MKHLKIFIILLLGILIYSCFDDKGNYTYLDKREVNIDSINESYTLKVLDTLKITPEINLEDNGNLEYTWLAYKFGASGLTEDVDTIGEDKNLNYKITLNPVHYVVTYKIHNTDNNESWFKQFDLFLETNTSVGWYILKDNGEETDLDYFGDEKYLYDLIKSQNGENLHGKAKSLGFTGNYSYIDPLTDKTVSKQRCLVALSEHETNVIRIDDSKCIGTNEDLFYEVPENCNPELFFSDIQYMFMINDGKFYSKGQDGRFGLPKQGDYKLSPKTTRQKYSSYFLYDENECTFYAANAAGMELVSFKEEPEKLRPGKQFWDLNSDLLFIGSKLRSAGLPFGEAFALLKKRTDVDSLLLGHLDLKQTSSFGGYKNPMFAIDTLNPNMNLGKGQNYACNKNYDLIYFSYNNKLYCYNIITKQEQELTYIDGSTVLAGDEEITYMQHIVYNGYGDDIHHFDHLVVATYDGENYKFYLFNMQGENLLPDPKIMEGEGKVKWSLYITPKVDQYAICY